MARRAASSGAAATAAPFKRKAERRLAMDVQASGGRCWVVWRVGCLVGGRCGALAVRWWWRWSATATIHVVSHVSYGHSDVAMVTPACLVVAVECNSN